jgi:hypothetical protein
MHCFWEVTGLVHLFVLVFFFLLFIATVSSLVFYYAIYSIKAAVS